MKEDVLKYFYTLANLSCKFPQLIKDFFFFNSHVAYQIYDILDLYLSKFGRILCTIFQKSHPEHDFVTSVQLIHHISIRNTKIYDGLHVCSLFTFVITFFFLFIYSIQEDIYILAHLRRGDGGAGRTTNSRGSFNVRISNPEEKKPIEVDR